MRNGYAPHKSQQVIHAALRPFLSSMEVMVLAGRRFGKTILAINEIVKRAIEIPGARIWYIAPTKDQAYRIAWRLLFKYLPAETIKKIREDRHTVDLKNGSLIEFLGTQDQTFLLGAGLHFVVFDEFPSIAYSVWEDVVRPMMADYSGDALFIGTVPDPKIHNISPQFIDMFEEKVRAFRIGEAPETAFNFSSFDNPYINHAKVRKDIADMEKKGRGDDAKRLYYGKYTREYGLVFPGFNYDTHTYVPFEIPAKWVRVMAVDPHPQKPIHAVWGAVDPGRELWIYREEAFVEAGGDRPLTVAESAARMRLLETEAKEKIRLRLIDPTFAKVEQKVVGTKSVVRQYQEMGLYFREANRDFMSFFNLMTDRLVAEPHPTIHFSRDCPGLIRQFQGYMWDAWASSRAREEKGAKDRPKNVRDDFVSCSKYIINADVQFIDEEKVKAFRGQLERRWAEQQSACQ